MSYRTLVDLFADVLEAYEEAKKELENSEVYTQAKEEVERRKKEKSNGGTEKRT